MSTHTPGPWAYDPSSREVFANDPQNGCGWIALVEGNDSNDNPLLDSERLANARLIAAAPVLLAALELLLNVEGAALHGARLPGFVGLDVAYHFAAARAAIAAATESDEPPELWGNGA